jgi:gluconokinase
MHQGRLHDRDVVGMLSLNPLQTNDYDHTSPLSAASPEYYKMVSSTRVIRPSVAPTSPMLSPKAPPAASSTTMTSPQTTKPHQIWLVTGPAGCGKTTIAQFVAQSLNFPYVEGDEVGGFAALGDKPHGSMLTSLRSSTRPPISKR